MLTKIQVELEEYVKVNDIVYKINRNDSESAHQLLEHRRLDFKVCKLNFSMKEAYCTFQYTKQHLLNDPDQLVGLGQ